MEAMAETYTVEQVRQHNKPDDLWVIFHNKGTVILGWLIL